MTLRATESALTILQPVTIIGVRQPNNIFNIERALVDTDGTPLYTPQPSIVSEHFRCFCQVFYHKLESINHWKATLAFFTIDKTDRVKQFYQDANLGTTIEDVQFAATIGKPMVNPSIKTVSEGWNILHNGLKKISKSDVLFYNGVGKPPHREMIFKAVSDVSTPPDLTATIIVGDVNKPTITLTISRVAKNPSAGELHAVVNEIDQEPSVCHFHVATDGDGDVDTDTAQASSCPAEGQDYADTHALHRTYSTTQSTFPLSSNQEECDTHVTCQYSVDNHDVPDSNDY